MLRDVKAVMRRCNTLVTDFAGASALAALLVVGLYAPLFVNF